MFYRSKCLIKTLLPYPLSLRYRWPLSSSHPEPSTKHDMGSFYLNVQDRPCAHLFLIILSIIKCIYLFFTHTKVLLLHFVI